MRKRQDEEMALKFHKEESEIERRRREQEEVCTYIRMYGKVKANSQYGCYIALIAVFTNIIKIIDEKDTWLQKSD